MIGPFGLSPKGTMRVRAMPLAKALTGRGHHVRVVMPPWHTPDQAGRAWEEDGVEVRYVTLGRASAYAATTLRLVREALAMDPDVVHCFKPKAYSGLAAWALEQRGRLRRRAPKLVIDEDDWEGPGGWNDLEPYSATMRRAFAWQEKWGLKHGDLVTVASRTLESLAWAQGVSPDRVRYLPNGAVDRGQGRADIIRSRYGLADAPTVMLYTRFFEYDVERAVAVLGRIHRECATARFLIVGQGLFSKDEARFWSLVESTGMKESTIGAGWVDAENLPDWLAAADVALYLMDDTLINRAKCPVKLVDLMAAGVPVVADGVGQVGEYIVHGESGRLVPPGDYSAMAEVALDLIADRAWRLRLGVAARRRLSENYHWQCLGDQLSGWYEELL